MIDPSAINPEAIISNGYALRRQANSEEARKAFRQAVNLSRDAVLDARPKARHTLARSLTGLGQIERDLGQIPAALQHYQEAAEILRGLNAPLALADAVRHVADIQRQNGDNAQSAANYAEALAIYRDQSETQPLDLANTLRGYALLKAGLGHPQAAIAHWQEARILYEKAAEETGLDLQPAFDEIATQISRLSAV